MLGLTPNLAIASQYIIWFRAHSVPMCVFPRFIVSGTFNFPEMWAVDSHILCPMHQSHNYYADLIITQYRVTRAHMVKCCDNCDVVDHHSNMFAFKMYLKSF